MVFGRRSVVVLEINCICPSLVWEPHTSLALFFHTSADNFWARHLCGRTIISRRKVGWLVGVLASIDEAVGADRSLCMCLVHELSRRCLDSMCVLSQDRSATRESKVLAWL